MTDIHWMKGRAWQLTWTGLVKGSPGEAVCIAVQLAGVIDDLEVVHTVSVEPPSELSLRLLHFR